MRQKVVNHRLMVGGIPCEDLARGFGTPLFVTDEQVIRENYRRIHEAFNRWIPTKVYYACKANSNLAILRILEQEGSSIDAVSTGEVFLCMRAGYPPERIMFTGTGVHPDEFQWLIERGVGLNIDSISDIYKVSRAYQGDISLRVNPEIGAGHHEHVITGVKNSKFGIPQKDIVDAAKLAKSRGLRVTGVHMHIGSGILTMEPILLAVKALIEVAITLEEKGGAELEWIDIGGGFGIPYRSHEDPLDIERVAEGVCKLVREQLPGKTLRIEPGRFIIGDSTVLLTRVNTIKLTEEKNYVYVDAGFNLLIRPILYGSYHHIVVADNVDGEPECRYDIVGPICESGDILGRERELPGIKEGDILAILDAGAYGFSMSSRYNSRPLCGEVLINGKDVYVIRERESYDDLLKGQRIPPHLEQG